MGLRLVAIFPIVCIAISLILSVLALIAGTHGDKLENYDLLTLNTSKIGHDIIISHLNKTIATPSAAPSTTTGSFWSQETAKIGSEIKNATAAVASKIESEINDELNEALDKVLKKLDIKDFYSLHIMDHCEGYFVPNNTANRNVTHCSDAKGLANFNITDELQSQLNKTDIPIDLPDIQLPEAISDGLHTLKLAFNACFIIYVIAIAFIALALPLGFVAVIGEGRMSAFANIGSSGAAFFFMMIASIITTVASTKAANAINDHGKAFNINAARGQKFISLTWASVAMLIVATICWIALFIVGRRHHKLPQKPYQ